MIKCGALVLPLSYNNYIYFVDYDPAVVEQKEASQPACIPLSYVLKFITEASRREIQNMPPAADLRRRLLSAPKTPSVRSSTPTGYFPSFFYNWRIYNCVAISVFMLYKRLHTFVFLCSDCKSTVANVQFV